MTPRESTRRPLHLLLLGGCLLLAAAVALCATASLDELAAVVQSRRAALSDAAPARERRALDRAAFALAAPADDVREHLTIASKAASLLDSAFPGDSEFGPLLGAVIDDLAATVYRERAGCAFFVGQMERRRDDSLLGRAVARADRFAQRAKAAPSRSRQARFLRRASVVLGRAERRLGIDPWADIPDDPMPSFSLTDVNPNSATSGESVSPRDRLGKFSAWYFTAAT